MKLVCLLLAGLLCLGNIGDGAAQAQTRPPGGFQQGGFPGGFQQGGVPGGIPGQGGLTLGILNGLQGGSQNNMLQGLQGGFFDYPGSLMINPNKTEAVEELKRQCLAHSNQSVVEAIEQATNDTEKCVSKAMPNIQSMLGGSQSKLCQSMHRSLLNCMTDVTSKLELCMDDISRYIPGYNVEVFDSIFNFLCDEDEDYTMTLFMSMLKPNGCLQKVQEASSGCLSKTENFASSVMAAFRNITKSELCRDTAIWKDCLLEKVNEYCTGDMHELVTGMTKSMYKPCSSCNSVIPHTFVLVLFVLVTNLF